MACGEATPDDLNAARLREMDALGDVGAAKADMAELFFAMLRVILADPDMKYALMLRLLDVLGPALETVADRLDDLEQLAVSRRVRA